MYITGLVICWIIAIIIVTADPKMESNRWYSFAAFIYGFFWIGLIIHHRQLLPQEFFQMDTAQTWEGFFYSVTHYFLPYSSLMYALSYTGFLARWKKPMALVLLIPVIVMYVFFPVTNFCNPGSKSFTVTMSILLLWLVPYLLGVVLLLLVTYFKAKNRWEKQDRMLTCLAVIPCIFMVIFIEFLFGMNKLNINSVAKVGLICGVFELIIILFGITSFGIFGVKLQVEKNRLCGTIQSMTFGTAFINHIVKNEILKVAMCTENIKPYLRNDLPMINESITVISNSTQHMLSMIERIQKQMGELKIKMTPNDIVPMIDDVLLHLKPMLEAKNIKVYKNYVGEVVTPCDSFHMREVLTNLIKNAVEAMKLGGELTITISEQNKRVVLAIKDNGSGIDKEDLLHVMEPFFTTKDRKKNFGLGLSYCYNVMQRQAGTIEIVSKKGVGTTVFLNFAKKRKGHTYG